MGLLDNLFREKVEINYVDESGVERTTKVSKKEFDKWQKEGKISKLKEVQAYIAGSNGEKVETWTIGVNVSQEDYEKYKEKSTGSLYVGETYRGGELEQYFMSKNEWKLFRKI